MACFSARTEVTLDPWGNVLSQGKPIINRHTGDVKTRALVFIANMTKTEWKLTSLEPGEFNIYLEFEYGLKRLYIAIHNG